uniref:Gnk2-homologous domain-containing protein n=1 Tax=Setaria italica TaxID=4555 RepID=K4A0F6_SETIT
MAAAVLPSRLLFLLLLLSSPSLFLAAAQYAEYSCNGTAGNFTSGSAFAASLDRLIAELPGNASSSPSLFASATVGGGSAPDMAYGLALCRGDVTDRRACSSCLADAFSSLRRLCGADRDATFYADLCTARYSGADFLSRGGAGEVDNSPVINGMDFNASTYPGWDARNATSRSFFLSLVGTLFGEMAMYGAYNSSRRLASAVMFINAQLPTVYGFAQCTPDLAPAQCWHCFQGVADLNRQWYDGREGGRISGVRCSFRYEGYKFYQGRPDVRIGGQHGDESSPNGSTNVDISFRCLYSGYMSPEYASEGIFSIKSDVYSFGVLLLEIVSGKRNSSHHQYGDFINLLGYAWQLWREGRAFELIDPTLGECGEVATIMRCVKVALLCVQDSAADRPTMADVTAMLAAGCDGGGSSSLPDPKRPPHFSLRVSSSEDGSEAGRTRSSSHATTSCSTNDLTVTTIQEGR